jgi:hypothetical protein
MQGSAAGLMGGLRDFGMGALPGMLFGSKAGPLATLGQYGLRQGLGGAGMKALGMAIPGLGQAVQQVGPFVDFQKFTLPKQQQLGNVPVGSNAWNKSIQIALGMSPNMADGVWGPQSQKMLDNFKMRNPKNFDAALASKIKPLSAPKQPSIPAPGSGASPVDY